MASKATQPGATSPAITLYGTNWCSDCKRSKKFFGEQRLQYDFVDIESDEAGMLLVEEKTKASMSFPSLFSTTGRT